MRPYLHLLGDGDEHAISELIERLAAEFALTDEERRELLPSGKQARFDNRVHWVGTHFSKAGLLARTGRARVRITERGRDILRADPPSIDMAFLSRYPEYRAFSDGVANQATTEPTLTPVTQTPEELLEANHQSLREALAEELLDRVKRCSSAFFERLVVDLLVAMGYGGSRRDAGQAVGGVGDGGIDGIIKEDKLGLDFVYIQAKRWDGPVSRPTVQAFAGSLEGHRARKGVMITTSRFTSDAKSYVERIEKRIVLVDGEQLSGLMIEHGIGVNTVATYEVKRTDADYFEEV